MTTKGYLGIDVSKGYADFMLLDRDCQVQEELFQLSDTAAGHRELKKIIDLWQKQGLAELYCGVESTGGYENNWHSMLKGIESSSGSGLWVARLNARAVKAGGDALLRRTITDGVSAVTIASYLAKYPEKVDYGKRAKPTDEQHQAGRQFITGIRMWTKQKVQLSNQLEKLLYQNLSPLLVYCRNGLPGWLLRMLVKYSSAEAIVHAGAAKLEKIKGISAEKSAAIMKKFTDHQPVQPPAKALTHLISITATEVLHQQSLIDTGKDYLGELYQQDAGVKLLVAIKGIGLDSAVAIILQIEDVARFESAKKLASYFGVHPCFKQSGDGMWGNHISKQGRGDLRAVLYMVGMSAVRYNPMFTTLYARFRAKGMKHKQAMGVVMHKLLRVIYGVLKSGKPFDEQTEEKHRQQAAQKQAVKKEETQKAKQTAEQKKHRFETIAETAPVSGRNLKARKKQLASQTSIEANAGLPTGKANI